ncbi:MAG TPA: permease, partial [Candidatus Eisenbacteria bacterium]
MNPSATLATVGATFLDASIEILPFFLLAIFLGALIEEFVSEKTIVRFLTGTSPGTMVLASTVGAVLPLCTCGMVPLAVSLRRRGSDLKHTFAFLTAGAAVSVPVLLLTWKVLGGWWAIARFATSVIFGLLVGYASTRVLRSVADRSAQPAGEPVTLAPIGGKTALLGGAIGAPPAAAA